MTRRRETRADARARRAAVDDPAVVLDAAARFLEVRPRSIAEVRRRLHDNGYRDDLAEGAIARLVDLGMLDDAAFARAWVESRDRARPRGEWALRSELYRKGVAADVITAVLEDRAGPASAQRGDMEDRTTGGVDEVAAARLLERRAPTLLREPDPRRRRAKAYALLARSGFAPDVCAAVAAAWVGGASEAGE